MLIEFGDKLDLNGSFYIYDSSEVNRPGEEVVSYITTEIFGRLSLDFVTHLSLKNVIVITFLSLIILYTQHVN
jgi:hypothetical protein